MKTSQELKEKILNNLTEWSMDPASSFCKSDEIIKETYDSLEDYWYPNRKCKSRDSVIGLHGFTDEDYCRIKRAMIDEIKKSPQDWHIEKEGSSLTIFKHKSGRKHYEEGFANKEKDEFADEGIKEIKNALNQQETPQQNHTTISQQEQPPKKIEYMGRIYRRFDNSKY